MSSLFLRLPPKTIIKTESIDFTQKHKCKTKPKNGGGYKCGKSVIVRFSHSLFPSQSPFLIAGNSNPSRGSLLPSFPPLCLPLYSNPVTLSFSASVSLQVGLLGDGKFLGIAGRLKLQSRPHTCTQKRTKHTTWTRVCRHLKMIPICDC